ncbi:Tat pathway signal protein [Treponema ruminis]|uniref:tripartite tricarboxylate transporter permease n=1 Tax=Treponema ruminis TaxID=744515 RepID=UPI0019807D9F|nr:tripartite tricarboxylate transporter permease [Treponema ruminis]QSI03282.1 Tat pathway signal protein [Treponema ruminis]
MSNYLAALLLCFQPANFILLLLCVLAGIIFGAIPGLNGSLGISLLLPLTFGMSTNASFGMLCGMYVGGVSGGFISAVLLGIPGTPSAIATCYDGYPMSKRGEAARALSLGIIGSFIGEVFSVAIASCMCTFIADLALKLGPWEYFSLCACAITLVAALSKENMAKGMMAAAIGLLIGCIGLDPITGVPRFTFGEKNLTGGIDITALMLGAYALSQIAKSYARGSQKLPDVKVDITGNGLIASDFTSNIVTIVKALMVGLWIGFLPGMGSALSNMVSYSFCKSTSKHPERFGTGCPEGILASEVSNNAATGGALIPMISLGIPGDGATSLLLGALTIHGLTAGPLMMQQHPVTSYLFFAYMLVGAFIVLAVEMLAKRWFPYILKIPYHYLYTAILVMCYVGSFTSTNTMFNVRVMIVIAVLALFMDVARVPMSPLILAYILSSSLEEYLRKGMTYSPEGAVTFVKRPLSLLFLLIALGCVIAPVILPLIRKDKGKVANGSKLED